jgi:hypothetical protein
MVTIDEIRQKYKPVIEEIDKQFQKQIINENQKNFLAHFVFSIHRVYLSAMQKRMNDAVIAKQGFRKWVRENSGQASENLAMLTNFAESINEELNSSKLKQTPVIRYIPKASSGMIAAIEFKEDWYIYYDEGIPKSEARYALAHELGHLFITTILQLDPGDKEMTEHLVNYVAYLIISDRSNFYEKEAQQYIESDEKIKQNVEKLLINKAK